MTFDPLLPIGNDNENLDWTLSSSLQNVTVSDMEVMANAFTRLVAIVNRFADATVSSSRLHGDLLDRLNRTRIGVKNGTEITFELFCVEIVQETSSETSAVVGFQCQYEGTMYGINEMLETLRTVVDPYQSVQQRFQVYTNDQHVSITTV
jgi:hypothetical protein